MDQFQTKAMWKDEEVVGRIYTQYSEISQALFIPDDKKNSILLTLMNCMTKLSAVKYHYINYKKIEDDCYNFLANRLSITGKPDNNIEEQYHLIFEIEAFLYQFKSSLDSLVKILCPIFNLQPGQISSFGENGAKIIKTINNQSSKKYDAERRQDVVNIINEDKDTWLKFAIDLRNKISHYESLRDITFKIVQIPDGSYEIIRTFLNNKFLIGESLEVLTYNLITFHQDFFCNALQIIFPPPIILRLNNEEDIMKLTETYNKFGKYIKYNLGARL